MATFVLKDVTSYVHGYDITTDSNQVTLSPDVDVQDATTFGNNGFRAKRGGLKQVSAEIGGFFEGTPDSEAFTSLGSADRVVSVMPQGATGGNVAYIFKAGNFAYQAFGAVGEMTPFTLSMEGTDGASGLVRGQFSAGKTSRSSTGSTGTPVNLGAGAAGKYLYVALHVFSIGTTVSVSVVSASDQAFTTPHTITGSTLGPITATGGYFLRTDPSVITGGDTWYRISVTAITGACTFAASIGIQ